jgi:hypothetical protein
MRIVLKDRQFWIADDRDVRTWPFYKPALEQYLEYTTAEWQYDLYQAMRSALMADMPVRIAVHTHEQKQMTEFTAGHIANTTGGPQYNAKNVVCVVVSKQTPVGSVLS